MGNIMRRALAIAALTTSTVGGVLATSVPAAHAATVINVPGNYSTIQAGIDAAATGDTVEVAPGTYFEHLDFMGKAISVESTAGADSTTIDGAGTGKIVTFSHGEGRDSILRGFTITHAGSTPVWMAASPTIADNKITNNTSCDGGGIWIGGGAPRITHNLIAGNTESGCTSVGGGGIALFGNGSAEVTDNQILGNAINGGGGGIVLFGSGPVLIANNQIIGNRASGGGEGGGMWIVNDSPATIVQNLITDNMGSGVTWGVPFDARPPTLVDNTIARNNGPALDADGYDANALVANNVFSTMADHAVVCRTVNDKNPPNFSHNIAFTQMNAGWTWSGCDPTGTNGNLTADPLFVAPDDHNPGDFHLSSGSPAIDAGDNTARSMPTTDLDSNPRITDGDANGLAVVDMGAYETAGAQFTSTIVTSSTNPSVTGSTVTFSAAVTAASGTPTGTVQFYDGGDSIGPASTLSSGTASVSTSSLSIGAHPITAVFSPSTADFTASTSNPIVQRVGYGVKLVYDTAHIFKVGDNVHIKVQLLDSTGTNVSASTLVVTAQCVVPAGGSCGGPGAIAINKPFTFHKQDKGQSFYDYEVRSKGMTPGTYDVVFTAAGDPVQHTAPLILKK